MHEIHRTSRLKNIKICQWLIYTRLILQPLLQAKIGRIFLRNKITLARYQFNGKGPYFLEWEHDILLKNGDFLYTNDFSMHLKFNLGKNYFTVFTGIFYEWIHADFSGLTKRRFGTSVHLSSTGKRYFLSQRLYARAGINLEDPNRDGEGFLLIGYGVDF